MATSLNTFWVGIDVSKASFDAALCRCAAAPGAGVLPARKFDSTSAGVAAFVRWASAAPGTCEGLCAESTGIYSSDLAEAISAAAPTLPPLSIVNPAHIKATARVLGLRDKNDAADARTIAVFAAWRRPAPKPRAAEAFAQLRALVDAREVLLVERDAFKDRISNSRNPACIKAFEAVVKGFCRQIESIERQLSELVEGDELLRRHCGLLESVPAIGPVIARTLLAYFGDLSQWTRRQIVAAAGLFPRVHESGTSVRRRPRLAGGGGGRVRKKLYMGAIGLLRKDHGFNRTALRLREEKRPPLVCMGAAMRKLLVVARGVIVSGKPYDKDYGRQATKGT